MVCITGQVPSPLIGSDAFQETDVTGITLPITKHNYLVTDVRRNCRISCAKPSISPAPGRPGPVLIDISKDAQQASIELELRRQPDPLPGYRPDLSLRSRPTSQRAVELIHRRNGR